MKFKMCVDGFLVSPIDDTEHGAIQLGTGVVRGRVVMSKIDVGRNLNIPIDFLQELPDILHYKYFDEIQTDGQLYHLVETKNLLGYE